MTDITTTLGLLSTDEMAGVLQVSPQTLATWRCKKRGPPSIKLGKKVFYLINEFNSWMQSEVLRQRGKRVSSPSARAHLLADDARPSA